MTTASKMAVWTALTRTTRPRPKALGDDDGRAGGQGHKEVDQRRFITMTSDPPTAARAAVPTYGR